MTASPPADPPLVFHHHAYKCAGTTFAAILERNFPGRVLYAEATEEGHRLPWQAVLAAVERQRPAAVSSHLATVPPRGQGVARLHVSFVREPRARLVSAFLFEQQREAPARFTESFAEYLDRVRFDIVSNFQTRHLSIQDFGGWTRRAGWEARPELISFARPDLFVGVVERMEESLLVLEYVLGRLGVAFDAAYARPENVSLAHERLQRILREHVYDDLIELDTVLWERANVALSAACRRWDIGPAAIEAFRARCAAVAADDSGRGVPSPDTWTYLAADVPVRAGGGV